jgi:hypothetical protein
MLETEFQDVDPWQEPTNAGPPRPSSTTASAKEKVLKMSSLIAQSDIPPTLVKLFQVGVTLQNMFFKTISKI